jgi:hypothetical protein
MTVNEMHIAVNLGVQKIASFQADILLPQEIDFELNIAMMRFIKQRYNPMSNRQGRGFEQSQKRVDDLRNLVVTTNSNTLSTGGFLLDALGWYIYNTSNTNIYIEKATLPLDYLFLVSVTAEVHYNCNGPINVDTQLVNEVTTTDWVKMSLTPPLPGYILTSISYFDGVNWISAVNLPLGQQITSDDLILPTNYLGGFIPSYNANVLENLNNTGAQLDPPVDSNHIYLSNSTTVLQADPVTAGFIRATWILPTLGLESSIQVYETIKSTYSVTRRTAPSADKRLSQCWFAQSDDIPTVMKDPFSRTGYDYVPYSIKENYINLYSDNTFVVPTVHIVYIRKPKVISITGGVGCELAEHTHQEIVEMTIKSILEGIESQRYNSQSMENLESE